MPKTLQKQHTKTKDETAISSSLPTENIPEKPSIQEIANLEQVRERKKAVKEKPGIRLICAQDALAIHLNLVSHAVPQRPTHPILGNVLLVASKETQQVDLTVFDLNLGIKTSFDAKVIDGGQITIPVGLLCDIVGRFPNGDITFDTNTAYAESLAGTEESLIATLRANKGRYQMRGLSTEEFPNLPKITSTRTIHLSAETLKEGLKGTLFATSPDEAKRILTGVHLKIEEDSLNFAATDGHRLAVRQTSIQVGKKKQKAQVEQPLEFTVPAKALMELERILASRNSIEPVQFSYEESIGTVAFQWGKTQLISRCLDGQYPAYLELLKQDFKQQITLEKAPLVKALERIAVLADKKEKTVKIHVNSEEQEISLSMLREFGNGQEEIPACINGSSLFISFNIKYFLEGVKAINTSELQIHLTQSDGPAVLIPFGDRHNPNMVMDGKYLLMPVFTAQ